MILQVNSRFLYTFISALIILAGSLFAIQYAKGGFRITDNGFARQTGVLSATSFPTAAEVYINGKMVTLTDDTLYLDPGTYSIEIFKDGYSPWRKELTIEKELVTVTNAQLFPTTPSLTPLTFTGAQNISPSPDGQKLLYYTASASAQAKKGLYVMELTNSFLSLQRGPKQIAEDDGRFDLSTVQFIWSPDSSQVMLISPEREVLLETDQKNVLASLPDISFSRKQILSEWQQEMYVREREFLREFPDEVIAMATQSARNVYFSPDKKRLLYTATAATTLPPDLVPPVPAPNSQPESRQILPGMIYVYDREEDRNFAVGLEPEFVATPQSKQLLALDLSQSTPLTLQASPSAFTTLQASTSALTASSFNAYYTPLYAATFQWYPDSKHLLYVRDNQVRIKSYDNTNESVLYSGPFNKNFLYPWPDGSKALILTSFSPEIPPNLYAIEVK